MRAFACPVCSSLVFFENSRCLACSTPLGFSWPERRLVDARPPRRPCANALLAGCNWVVAEPGRLCQSCVLTRTRPADGDGRGLARFTEAEAAKRRLLFELGELGLFDGSAPAGHPLTFDLLSSEMAPVATGHADGLITLDLAEADDAHREHLRQQLSEPYRTVVGHFRHEIAHYYWPVLVTGDAVVARCREVFGDDREDYGEALQRHYDDGPPGDWPDRFVSAYATMHPWEDWAETFAQLLHIRDAMQTAAAYGVTVGAPQAPVQPTPAGFGGAAAGVEVPIRDAIGAWLPLSFALNAVNRSLGHDDLYPYVLTAAVIDKLAFIDELVQGWRP